MHDLHGTIVLLIELEQFYAGWLNSHKYQKLVLRFGKINHSLLTDDNIFCMRPKYSSHLKLVHYQQTPSQLRCYLDNDNCDTIVYQSTYNHDICLQQHNNNRHNMTHVSHLLIYTHDERFIFMSERKNH